MVPGDPARLAAGPQGTQATYDKIRVEFGLDDPLVVQYWHYLTGLFRGDCGEHRLFPPAGADRSRRLLAGHVKLVIIPM